MDVENAPDIYCNKYEELVFCIRDNDTHGIARILNPFPSLVHERDPTTMRSLIHNAVEADAIDSIRVLHQFRASMDLRDRNGDSPLMSCIRRNNVKIAYLLLDFNCNMHEICPIEKIPIIFISSKLGMDEFSLRILECIIENDLVTDYLQFQGKHSASLVHYAAAGNCARVLQRLVQCGSNLLLLDQFGQTPLHYSCENGAIESSTVLIENGLSLTMEDSRHVTALNLVRSSRDRSLLQHIEREYQCFGGSKGKEIRRRNKPDTDNESPREYKSNTMKEYSISANPVERIDLEVSNTYKYSVMPGFRHGYDFDKIVSMKCHHAVAKPSTYDLIKRDHILSFFHENCNIPMNVARDSARRARNFGIFTPMQLRHMVVAGSTIAHLGFNLDDVLLDSRYKPVVLVELQKLT